MAGLAKTMSMMGLPVLLKGKQSKSMKILAALGIPLWLKDSGQEAAPGEETTLAPPLVAPQPPPSASEAGSLASLLAERAAEKQRKRASAGGSVLSGAYRGKTGPKAVLQPKTLIGT